MTIPRHFLLLHNPCNIWNRIGQFLSLYLPNEEKILKSFTTNREWAEDIRKESLKVVSMKSIPNYTLENDVPLSIRITELIVKESALYNTRSPQKQKKKETTVSKRLSNNSEQLTLSSYSSR